MALSKEERRLRGLEATRRWRAKNRERVNKAVREWARRNPQQRLKRYGLTMEDFERMRRETDYRCPVCARDFSNGSDAHVDHCHETGKVRGLLCGPCNRALGMLKEDPERMRALAEYIERTGAPRE